MAEIAIGPWRRRARRVAYGNAWITVFHDDVVRPDGEPGIYGVVSFRTRAVGVVAMDGAGRVLLVGQHRYTLDAYSWEIPEGGVPFDEAPIEGARRELAEETGYHGGTWREVLQVATSNSITDETGSIFIATGLEPGEPRPEGTEELVARWVPLDDAIAMIDHGEITDAMSQAGLLRVALEQGRGRR